MIVTSSADGTRGYVVLQTDHTDLAWQLAKAFGNAQFAAPEPRRLMEFLALNHDRGWDEIDASMPRDPQTGLPFSLVKTPFADLLRTGPRSIEFNAAHHAYCGVLVAMHVWGLFNGRYGLSDKVVVSMLSGEAKIRAEAMLAAVREREATLRAQVAADPEFAHFLAPSKLMQNYKILQFFDTLSLYFNERVGQEGSAADFLHVPLDEQRDVTVSVTPLGDKAYRLSPYPFAETPLPVHLHVHDVAVAAGDNASPAPWRDVPTRTEHITLVA